MDDLNFDEKTSSLPSTSEQRNVSESKPQPGSGQDIAVNMSNLGLTRRLGGGTGGQKVQAFLREQQRQRDRSRSPDREGRKTVMWNDLISRARSTASRAQRHGDREVDEHAGVPKPVEEESGEGKSQKEEIT